MEVLDRSNDLVQARGVDDSVSLSPAQLLPQRNPNIIRKMARLWFRNEPTTGPQAEQQQTSQSGVVVQALQSVYDQYFRSQSDRLAIYKDVDEMDAAAEEASVSLDTIADNVTTSEDGQQRGFTIETEDAQVLDILHKVVADADIATEIYSITRNAVKYGDVFMEIVINKEGEVVQAKQLPPSTMFRNQDAKGNLLVGEPLYDKDGKVLNKARECAFEQRAEDTQTIVATFYPWQVVHGRFNHDGYSPYGRSLLRVTRIIWKKLKAQEEGLIMGRLVRAMLKLVFYVDTTGLSPSQKQTYLQQFKSTVATRASLDGQRENPFYVLTDFFISDGHYRVGGEVKPSRSRVEILDPRNEGLNQITDIKYFHRKMIATLRVPPAHMGFEEQVNAKSTLTQQDVQYIRFLRSVQSFVSKQLQQVFDTALILQGLSPTEHKYKIKWPLLSAADEAAAAQAQFNLAQADAIYLGNSQQNLTPVVDAEWIQRHRFNWSDEEVKEYKERIKIQHAEQLERQQLEADQDFENKKDMMEEQARQFKASGQIPGKNGGMSGSAVSAKKTPPSNTQQKITAPKNAGVGTSKSGVSQEAAILATAMRDEMDQLLGAEIDQLTLDTQTARDHMQDILRKLFPR